MAQILVWDDILDAGVMLKRNLERQCHQVSVSLPKRKRPWLTSSHL